MTCIVCKCVRSAEANGVAHAVVELVIELMTAGAADKVADAVCDAHRALFETQLAQSWLARRGRSRGDIPS